MPYSGRFLGDGPGCRTWERGEAFGYASFEAASIEARRVRGFVVRL